MQKPVMIKRILVISVSLLCLLFSSQAEARLTLGVVTAAGEASDAVTTEQVNSLAALIAGKLDQEVVIKNLDDSEALINWLDRFASLDLALLSAEEVKTYRGRFLMIGQLDESGSLNLVARQGVPGDLPQLLAGIISDTGFSPWRSTAQSVTETEPDGQGPPAIEEVRNVDAVAGRDDRSELQQRPPLTVGQSWGSEVSRSLEFLPDDKPQLKKLVLGVVPDPTGIVRNGEQAAQLAAYLESLLPVDVTIREFEKIETFAAWFVRYKMIDLAVISSELAVENLGRDYLPINKLFRSDKPGEDSAELLVVRRGQAEDLQSSLQQALLGMQDESAGQKLMANLKISKVFVPGLEGAPVEAVAEEQTLGVAPPVGTPSAEPPVQEKLEIVFPEPAQPPTPAVVLVQEPQVPSVAEPESAPAPPEMPELLAVAPGEEALTELLQKTPEPEYPEPEKPLAPLTINVEAAPVIDEIVKPEGAPFPGPSPMEMPIVPGAPTVPAVPAFDGIAGAPAELDVPAPVAPPEVVVVEAPEVAIIPAPEVTPPLPPEVAQPALPEVAVVEEVIETEAPAAPAGEVAEPVAVASAEQAEPPVAVEEIPPSEKSIIEEVMEFADPVSPHELSGKILILGSDETEAIAEEDFVAMLGDAPVASMVAQPDLPQELRPVGVPIVRPGRLPSRKTVVEEELLVASLPEPLRQVEPATPPVLLPQPDPDPGIVYVVPFVSVMVPEEVSSRIFDQFIDSLNQQGESLGLQFLILKEGLQRVAPEWLAIRKYVTGEIYAYVEDSGCCSTDLRSKSRLTYRSPDQLEPDFRFEYPVRTFFDHDKSSLEDERSKMAVDVATTLANELVKAIQK